MEKIKEKYKIQSRRNIFKAIQSNIDSHSQIIPGLDPVLILKLVFT